MHVIFDRANRPAIEHFARRGRDPARGDLGDRFGGVVDRIVNREQRFHRFRHARQLHRNFRDQCERAFRADEKPGQIVSGRIERGAAEAHQFAARQAPLSSRARDSSSRRKPACAGRRNFRKHFRRSCRPSGSKDRAQSAGQRAPRRGSDRDSPRRAARRRADFPTSISRMRFMREKTIRSRRARASAPPESPVPAPRPPSVPDIDWRAARFPPHPPSCAEKRRNPGAPLRPSRHIRRAADPRPRTARVAAEQASSAWRRSRLIRRGRRTHFFGHYSRAPGASTRFPPRFSSAAHSCPIVRLIAHADTRGRTERRMPRPESPCDPRPLRAVRKSLDEHFETDYWTAANHIPREELLKRVARRDVLVCLLTEKVDEDLLASAGACASPPRFRSDRQSGCSACTRHKVVATNTPGVLRHDRRHGVDDHDGGGAPLGGSRNAGCAPAPGRDGISINFAARSSGQDARNCRLRPHRPRNGAARERLPHAHAVPRCRASGPEDRT